MPVRHLKVVVGSLNKPKLGAVKQAFEQVFPDQEIMVEGVAADSGVTSHPTSGEETLQGAANRAMNARALVPDGDFYVGIEGGLLKVADRVWEVSLVAVADRSGEISTGLSPAAELRGALLQAVQSGQELSEAIHEHYSIKEIGKANGYYGLITDNILTREQACVQAVIFALAPFRHTKYFS